MTPVSPAPAVTIAMPVFNGGAQLSAALASILAQTFTDWELLLIDDGSSDGAIETLPANLDSRISILSDGTNLGLAARLNQAIDLARGRYFARMDQDDIAHPERIEQQVRFMDANPRTDLLGAKCISISESGAILGQFPFHATHSDICRRPWLGFYLPHPTWLGRIEWFRRYRYAQPAPFRCEDQELLLRAHSDSQYHALDTALLAYRVRDSVNMKTRMRTRMALARVQCGYFLQHRAIADLATALVATAARLVRDILFSWPGNRRAEIAAAASTAEQIWWTEWLLKMQEASRFAR